MFWLMTQEIKFTAIRPTFSETSNSDRNTTLMNVAKETERALYESAFKLVADITSINRVFDETVSVAFFDFLAPAELFPVTPRTPRRGESNRRYTSTHHFSNS